MGKSKIGDTAVENTVKIDTSTPTSEKFVSCDYVLSGLVGMSTTRAFGIDLSMGDLVEEMVHANEFC